VLVAVHVNVFARESATPGSLYAFVNAEFGQWAGIVAGWGLLIAYIGTAGAVTGGIILYVQGVFGAAFGTVGGASALIVGSVGVGAALAYRNVELSTRFMLWIECASVATIVLLFLYPSHVHALSWDPAQMKPNGAAVRAGLVLATFAFVGFESATALGAEAREPLTTIPRAVLGTAIVSGIFFVFCAYAEVAAVEPKLDLLAGNNASLQVLAQLKGVAWVAPIVSVGAVVSFFACSMACINASARTALMMGARGILPAYVGRAHAEHRTPHTGVVISALLAIVAAVGLIVAHVSAFDLNGWLGTIATYGFMTAYLLIVMAAPVRLYRRGRLTVAKGALSAVTIGLIVAAFVGSIDTSGTGPERWLAPVYVVLLAVGCAICVVTTRVTLVGVEGG
jgi:amino acid transporter